jgi:hypothetical protein
MEREELRWDFRGAGVVEESWMTYDALVDWDWGGWCWRKIGWWGEPLYYSVATWRPGFRESSMSRSRPRRLRI